MSAASCGTAIGARACGASGNATGLASGTVAVGDGRVLRRNRGGRSTEVEALTMQHCGAHGYPVPEVFDADGPDIVMQRLDGPTMLAEMSARPWTMRAMAL